MEESGAGKGCSSCRRLLLLEWEVVVVVVLWMEEELVDRVRDVIVGRSLARSWLLREVWVEIDESCGKVYSQQPRNSPRGWMCFWLFLLLGCRYPE